MAKKSMIARDVKRKKLVERYASKRKSLLDQFNSAKDPMERLEIHRKINSPGIWPRACWISCLRPFGVFDAFATDLDAMKGQYECGR